jgi:DNA-binding response OmpR family regulator
MKILVVEDNVKLNETIKIYLTENNFSVDVAFNGVQALSKVKDLKKKNGEEYDVIILDRMMPMQDGVETMREIKNLGIKSGIIILTAKDTVEDKVFGLAAGADDYMVKPFNVKELVARIHSLYRRNILQNNIAGVSNMYNTESDLSQKNDYQGGAHSKDFSFNLSLGEIIFKNKEKEIKIDLTNKESNIFKILLDSSGKPVSKETILEKIWKEDEKPSSRFVDVHVHNLRSKLLKNNFKGRVETIRHAGYRLILD